MDKPFPAYKGRQPYVFVSYAHVDANKVYPEITRLKDEGFNIWYDEGIEAGTEWREELGQALQNAALFLFFVTPAAAASPNCRREVNFAVDLGTPFIPVYQTDLSAGLQMTISDKQAVMAHDMSRTVYEERLHSRLTDYSEVNAPVLVDAASQSREPQRWLIALSILAVVLLGGWFLLNKEETESQVTDSEPVAEEVPAEPQSTPPLIVMLPLENITGDDQTDPIIRGLTAEILTAFQALSDQGVIMIRVRFFPGPGQFPRSQTKASFKLVFE